MEDETYYEGYEDGRDAGRKDAIVELKVLLAANPGAVRTYKSALKQAIKRIEDMIEPVVEPEILSFEEKMRLIKIIRNV